MSTPAWLTLAFVVLVMIVAVLVTLFRNARRRTEAETGEPEGREAGPREER